MANLSSKETKRLLEEKELGGEEALKELTHRRRNVRNRVPEATENAIVGMAYEQPAYGQVRVSNELRKAGIIFSAQGVQRAYSHRNARPIEVSDLGYQT